MRRLVSGPWAAAVSAALLAASTLATPGVAHAQFGGLIKKAAQAAQDKANPSKGTPATGDALTEATFTQVLTGVRAADKVLADRDRMIAARDADQATLSNLVTQNEPARQAYNSANSTIDQCRSAAFESINKEFQAKMEAKAKALANDPQGQAKLQLIAVKYGKLMAEAQQKSDTAALAKAQQDMQYEMIGVDIRAKLKADTATVDSKCGKLPTPPAALAKEEQLRVKVDAENDSVRTYEAQALNAGAQASGLDRVKYLELKERLLSIYTQVASGSSRVAYGDAEVALVKQHREDLDAVKRAL